ncbi:hypothetical protein pb186bvf_015340 [Paramecium bursaria]
MKYRLQEQLFQDYYTIVKKKNRQLYCSQFLSKTQPYLNSTIQLLHSIQHPHVLPVKSLFDDNTNIVIVTDYFEGEPLFNFLVDNIKLLEIQLATLIYQILSLIKYLNENGAHHGNINAMNVLINRESQNLEIAIIGFLFSPIHNQHDSYLQSASIVPSNIQDKLKAPGLESDLYQLGGLLYMITFFTRISSDIKVFKTILIIKKKYDANKIYQQYMKEFKIDFQMIDEYEQKLIDLQVTDSQYRHIYSSSQIDLMKKLLGQCSLQDALGHRWFVNAKQKSKIKRKVGLPSLKTIIEIKELSSDYEFSRNQQQPRVSVIRASIDNFVQDQEDENIDEESDMERLVASLKRYDKFPARSHHMRSRTYLSFKSSQQTTVCQ